MTSSFYILFLWCPIYLGSLRGILTEKQADIMTFYVVLIYIIFLLCAGKLSDKFPHRQDLMKIGVVGVIFACPNMFAMFESESTTGYFFAQLQYAACLSLLQGGLAAWEVELWMADPTLSFTGVAMGHNIAATLFGGTMPLVATSLFYWANTLDTEEYSLQDLPCRMIPGFYISLLGVLSLVCLTTIIRHPHDMRTGEALLLRARILEKQRKKAKQRGEDGRNLTPSSTFGSVAADEIRSGSYIPPVH